MENQNENSRAQTLRNTPIVEADLVPPYPTSNRDLVSCLVRAGLLTGIVDGLFSSILSVAFYSSTVSRLFQGVASVVVGSEAMNGGARTTALGIVMHFGVAFGWSAVFLFLILRWRWIRAVLTSRFGTLKIALMYGPFIWMVMSLAVIPALVRRPPSITIRWWVQLIGHIPFVGLPIVASSLRAVRASVAGSPHH
jgi:hypothetical protein